jgi:hypothetical protein
MLKQEYTELFLCFQLCVPQKWSRNSLIGLVIKLRAGSSGIRFSAR